MTGLSLQGSYRLVRILRHLLDSGETVDMSGGTPTGHIMYGAEGRMMVMIIYPGRPHPESVPKTTDEERLALFKTLVAYGGTYTFDGKTVEHHVDVSWNESWTGTVLSRKLEREGELLKYTSAPAPSSDDGRMSVTTLVWEKVA